MKTTKVEVGTDKNWETLYRLRELTRMTGGLHELQVQQLKMWPLVFVNAADATTEFSFNNQTLIFKLSKLEGKRPKDFKKRLQLLVRATQELLGDEYTVTILLAGKEVYRGAAGTINA